MIDKSFILTIIKLLRELEYSINACVEAMIIDTIPNLQSGYNSFLITVIPPECKDNYNNLKKIYSKTSRLKMMNSLFNHEGAILTLCLSENHNLMLSSSTTIAIEPEFLAKFNNIKIDKFKKENRM